jgi:antitoxin component of MazEF toxin-antitoxin module
MKKIVKKWGDSFVVILSREDMKIYNLKEGDILDIEFCKEVKDGRKSN